MQRIIFLKGDVELKASREVEQIHEVRKMLEMAVKMEAASADDYNRWAIERSKNRAAGTPAD
jgi:bacterioferritin